MYLVRLGLIPPRESVDRLIDRLDVIIVVGRDVKQHSDKQMNSNEKCYNLLDYTDCMWWTPVVTVRIVFSVMP